MLICFVCISEIIEAAFTNDNKCDKYSQSDSGFVEQTINWSSKNSDSVDFPTPLCGKRKIESEEVDYKYKKSSNIGVMESTENPYVADSSNLSFLSPFNSQKGTNLDPQNFIRLERTFGIPNILLLQRKIENGIN